MPEYHIITYETKEGKVPYRDWFNALKDLKAKKAVVLRIYRLEQGLWGDYKVLQDGLRELRIDIGPGYRIYCAQVGKELVLLLFGADKREQSADIKKAQSYLEDYKRHHDSRK